MLRHLTTSTIIALSLLPQFVAAGVLSGRVDTVAGQGGAGFKKTDLPTLAGNIIQIALTLLGTIFLVMLVYGGYKWMLASGNEEEITKAKSMIWQAIWGLVVTMSAGAIAYFVSRGVEYATLQQ